MQTHEATRTLAFLFTDIEGSTQLWERFPESMRAALERHDEILHRSVEETGGEVVKTTGDGVMAVFASARDAARACLRAQLALVTEPWNEAGPLRVRMGLHVGEVAASGGDYHGPTVNRAARIMAAGHGGQVLLSTLAADLVADELPEGSTLLDLGEHHLKSLGRPERIFQLVHPDLPAGFPALTTIHDRAHSLPLETSGLVGREAELKEIEKRLREGDARLVTLLGPGGIGKTRLALRVAATLRDVFDGVYFVDLETTRGPDSVLVAIARSVGLSDASESARLDELVDHLLNRRCLVVLDNFEQAAPAAPTIARLLDDCPGPKVLVTSREALRIRGEHRFPVPPLSLPAAAAHSSAEELMRYEAIQLFVARAREIRPDFRLTDENAAAVAEICIRLDGLPLAIELATARIAVFSAEALRERLGSRLTLLRSGPRDLPERHQALRATIDWSYELLDPGEQRLVALLATFAGARLEAIDAVSSGLNGQLEGLDALDGLSSLVDKSLVRQVDAVDGEPRFVMLETIREYAAERLDELPDFGASARRAHAVYFADLVQRHQDELVGATSAMTRIAMVAEAENLGLCWRYWVAERNLERLNSVIDGLWALYEGEGWYGAAIELASDLLAVLASVPDSPESAASESMLRMSRARALMAMEGFTSSVEAEYTHALELFDDGGGGDGARAFPFMRSLGAFYMYRSEFDKAAEIGRRIQALADRQGDRSMRLDGDLQLGSSLGFLGDLHAGTGQLEKAIESFETSAYRPARFRVGSDPRVPSLTTSALFHWLLGFPDRALERADRAVALAAELDHPLTLAYAHFHSGLLHLWRREPELARLRALATLETADDHDLRVWTATGTVLHGAALSGLGEVDEGLSRIREGIGLYQSMKTPPVFWPMLLSISASACSKVGLHAEASSLVDEAVALVGDGSATPLLPELLLVRGDVLTATDHVAGDDPADSFRRALESARARDARTPQLRAATRLCRLARGAEAEHARRVLESIYATFTEGFATADLAEARELIEG